MWIKEPKTDVDEFIDLFMSMNCNTYDEQEVLRLQFRNGYCWHFAKMLQTTFGRGKVVWAAPFSHFLFEDVDGKLYDIEGEYAGEAYYMIPEECCPFVDLFKHRGYRSRWVTREEIINTCKNYLAKFGEEYDCSMEKMLENW